MARQREVVAIHMRGENEHHWPTVFDSFVQDDRAHSDVIPLGTSLKASRVCGGAIYTLDASSGKLMSERIYYDQAIVMQQMQKTQESAIAYKTHWRTMVRRRQIAH
jgi:hypothetical protein